MEPAVPSYRIRVLPMAHQLDCELILPALGAGPLRLETPTWVPGAYGFMKYGRDLFEVKVRDASTGRPLPLVREGWAGWRIDGATGPVAVTWRAGAFDHAWGELAGQVGHENAVLLATRYLYAPASQGPCRVRYELPEGWELHHPGGARELERGAFEYPSFAALLDTPVVCGRFDLRWRTVQGARLDFVFLDRAIGFESELDEFLDSVARVAEECRKVFGSFPFERYSFVFTFNPLAHWGLEHAHATMIALDPECLIDPTPWAAGVRVCAHELFHAWNVCRLKPAPLGEPDFSRGSFPEALWVSEGLTRYYEFLLLVRAGVLGPRELLSNVVNYYRQQVSHPAWLRVSLLDSSRSTFLNHNKYPGSVNATIDYYDKGALVAFDLDAALRLGSPASTLDERVASFYAGFAGKGAGFTHEQALAALSAGRPDAAELIRREVEEPGVLSTEDQLARLGFQVEREPARFLGIVLAKNGAGPALANVVDDGPAAQTGIAPDDEIQRVAGFPFSGKALAWAIRHQEIVELEVRRGHQVLTFRIPVATRPRVARLLWRGDAAQLERLRTWFDRPDLDFRPGEPVSLSSYENFHGIQTVL